MNQKVIALFLIASISLSAFSALELKATVKVDAASYTTNITLSGSPANPKNASQVLVHPNGNVTFTGVLTSINSTTHAAVPLTGRNVTIYYTVNGARYNVTNVTTDKNGNFKYQLTETTTGTWLFYASFAGEGSLKRPPYYPPATSTPIAIICTPTGTSINFFAGTSGVYTVYVKPNVTVNLTGSVAVNGGGALAGARVQIYYYKNGSSTRYNSTNVTTNAMGGFSYLRKDSGLGTRSFYAYYAGNATLAPSTSRPVNVTVTILRPTGLTLAASGTTGGTVATNAPFTLRGTLKTLDDSAVVNNTTVYLQTYTTAWTNLTSQKTDSTGNYSFSRSESSIGNYQYRVIYPGNATYANATSNVVTVGVRIKTVLTVSAPASAYVAQWFNLTGSLTAQDGSVLANQNISVYWNATGWSGWNIYTGVKTDNNGNFVVPCLWSNLKPVSYRVLYSGNSTYMRVQKDVTINIAKIPTTLTLSSNKTLVSPGEHYLLSGYLTDNNAAPLAQMTVQFYYQLKGSSTWNRWKNVTTDGTGYYSLDDVQTTTIHLYTEYQGDAQRANSTSNTVTVTMKDPTTLSLSSNQSYVYPSEHFTLSGDLRDVYNNPLPSRTVELYAQLVGGTSWQGNSTTDVAGHYSFDYVIWSNMTRGFYTTYNGDAQNANSTSNVVNVTAYTFSTRLTLTGPATTPHGGLVTLKGTLTSSDGFIPVANAMLTVQSRAAGTTTWNTLPNSAGPTDSNGNFSYLASATGSPSTMEFRAIFGGQGYAAGSTSNIVTVVIS